MIHKKTLVCWPSRSSFIHFQITMSAKAVSIPAVKFVETLQGAITVHAGQDTILMATCRHAKVTSQLIFTQRNHPPLIVCLLLKRRYSQILFFFVSDVLRCYFAEISFDQKFLGTIYVWNLFNKEKSGRQCKNDKKRGKWNVLVMKNHLSFNNHWTVRHLTEMLQSPLAA